MKTSSICLRTSLSCALFFVAAVATADNGPPLPPLPTLPPLPKTPAATTPPAPSAAPGTPGPSLSPPAKPSAPLPRTTTPAPRPSATQPAPAPAPVKPILPANPPTQTAPAPAPTDSGSDIPPALSGSEPAPVIGEAAPPQRYAAGYRPTQGVDPSLYYADAAPYGGRYPQPVGSPYYYNPDWSYTGGGNAYDIHFGPGFYRSNEYGHLRFPFYSYRRPWYTPGPAIYARDTNLAW